MGGLEIVHTCKTKKSTLEYAKTFIMLVVGNNQIILAILGRCNPSWLQINPSVSLNKIPFIHLTRHKQMNFQKSFKGSIDYQKLVLQMSFILTINDAKTRKRLQERRCEEKRKENVKKKGKKMKGKSYSEKKGYLLG